MLVVTGSRDRIRDFAQDKNDRPSRNGRFPPPSSQRRSKVSDDAKARCSYTPYVWMPQLQPTSPDIIIANKFPSHHIICWMQIGTTDRVEYKGGIWRIVLSARTPNLERGRAKRLDKTCFGPS